MTTENFQATVDKPVNIANTSTASTDPEVKKIRRARVEIIVERPFLGSLLVQMKMLEVTETSPKEIREQVHAIGTDGATIWWNREFIKKLNSKQVMFLLCHELYHVIMLHVGFSRRGSRDKKIWDYSCDYVVNWILKNEGIGEFINDEEHATTYSSDYDGMFVEEVFKILEKKWRNGIPPNMPGAGKPGEGGPMPIDSHIEGQSKKDKLALADKMRGMIQQAQMQTAGKGLSDPIKKLVADFLAPQMDWRQFLHKTLPSMFKSDWTYKKPGKRTYSSDPDEDDAEALGLDGTGDVIFPSLQVDEKVELHIFIDTSGSISEDMVAEMLSEVANIMDSYQDFTIHIFQFDTAVFGEEVFSTENLSQMEDLAYYKDNMAGNGGTDFECIFQYLKDENIVPHQLIVFTDGYPCGGWGDPNWCDTLWIIHGDDIKAPFGACVRYEDQAGEKIAGDWDDDDDY